jgi:hypothetical protein
MWSPCRARRRRQRDRAAAVPGCLERPHDRASGAPSVRGHDGLRSAVAALQLADVRRALHGKTYRAKIRIIRIERACAVNDVLNAVGVGEVRWAAPHAAAGDRAQERARVARVLTAHRIPIEAII